MRSRKPRLARNKFTFPRGTRVSMLRDIERDEGPYVRAQQKGTVLATFFNTGFYGNARGPLYVKVKMDESGTIKTLRSTTLGRL